MKLENYNILWTLLYFEFCLFKDFYENYLYFYLTYIYRESVLKENEELGRLLRD